MSVYSLIKSYLPMLVTPVGAEVLVLEVKKGNKLKTCKPCMSSRPIIYFTNSSNKVAARTLLCFYIDRKINLDFFLPKDLTVFLSNIVFECLNHYNRIYGHDRINFVYLLVNTYLNLDPYFMLFSFFKQLIL